MSVYLEHFFEFISVMKNYKLIRMSMQNRGRATIISGHGIIGDIGGFFWVFWECSQFSIDID